MPSYPAPRPLARSAQQDGMLTPSHTQQNLPSAVASTTRKRAFHTSQASIYELRSEMQSEPAKAPVRKLPRVLCRRTSTPLSAWRPPGPASNIPIPQRNVPTDAQYIPARGPWGPATGRPPVPQRAVPTHTWAGPKCASQWSHNTRGFGVSLGPRPTQSRGNELQ